jgi:electron transport complex protein RnfE
MKRAWKEFTKSFITSNPLFVICLGMCPALAMTVGLDQTIGMTLGLTFVLFWTSMIIATIRNIIPNTVRIPVFIVIISTFVTIVDLTFHGYLPSIYPLLGIYLPLITVNCIVMGRAEAFSSHNPILPSVADGLGMALGFGLAMLVIAIPRVLLGTGSLTVFGNKLFSIPVLDETPIGMMVLPMGAFLVIGLIHALLRRLGVEKRDQ